MTHATRILFLLSLFILFPHKGFTNDEEWGILQFRKRLDNDQQIFAEYVRRDQGALYSAKAMELYRLSWGGKWEGWTYLVGGAYIDFNSGSDENRLHQFFVTNFKYEYMAGFVRLGLEERSFVADDNVYFRQRTRLQVNVRPQDLFGFTIYDEAFYIPDGKEKFKNGLNENRLGLGLRFISPSVELYLFQVYAETKSLKATTQTQWLQLQTIINF